jgi:hypothetical protein
LLFLAACHGKQADTGKSAAAAEVLPGSASDAMIAYDTLKSQPPPAVSTDDTERETGAGRPGMVRGSGAAADDAAPSGEAVEAELPASGAAQ